MTRRSAYGLDARPDPASDWRQRGACTSIDPDLWTSPSYEDLGQARWICINTCPVIHQCLTWARQHPTLADRAVYGGLYWIRPTSPSGNPTGTPRPAGLQPALRTPGDSPGRPRRPEKRHQPHITLLPHLGDIRDLYAAGMSILDIARRYGCSDDAMRSFANRNGIQRPERVT